MNSWEKTVVSVGGETQGQRIPVSLVMYPGVTVASNNYSLVQSDNGQDGVDHNINDTYFDLSYTPGQTDTDYRAIAKIPVTNDQGVIVRYLGIRCKYRSEVAFGVTRLSVDTQIGYFDTSSNYTSMSDRGCQTYSTSSTVYPFKVRCHVCIGTAGNPEFDFFGAVCSIEATDRDKYVYSGTLDARSYVQGNKDISGDFSPEFGPASDPEGYETPGGYDDHSDIISIPPKPQSILSLGFLNVYKCGANALQDFGAAMFPEIQFPQSLSDVGEVLAAFSDSIWNSKLIDYVVSVHCVPGDVTAGNLEDIKVGARTMTGILARKITNEYVDFSFGAVSLAPYFKNYADYLTEVQLYLPMYGFVSLRPEEIIGGEVSVTYRFNVIDGSFTAYVLATSNRSKLKTSMIGQYGGSCVVHLPVSNLSYSSMFSSMVGGAASAAMGIASGGAGAVAGALAATNMATQAVQGGDVKKSNSYNASSSFMTRLQPYLIVTRPQPSFSKRYNIENGFPSNVAMTIGTCRGFTTAENAILDGIACTADEKQRLQNYLKTGIIIGNLT